ncbi:MAG: M48 family metallopeptidase [bacterium]
MRARGGRAPLSALEAKRAFKSELQRWAERIQVRPRRVQIQPMTRKWASCSHSGRLCFAADLLSQSAHFREVVIVHELVHLIVPNHGKLFKSMMRAYVPGWEDTLREHSSGKAIC